jgi:hypothetical protein
MCVHVIPHICLRVITYRTVPTVKWLCYSMSMDRRKNPQISSSVSVESYELLRQTSVAINQSMSSIIAELIEAASPHLLLVIEASKLAKDRRDEIPYVMQGVLNQAGKALGDAQADMAEVWNQVRRNRPQK